jgi:uncharacterized membrane protein YkvA (DUF1232 family)
MTPDRRSSIIRIMSSPSNYSKSYTEKSFWRKATKFATVAGKQVMTKALVLYYCYSDPTTPKWVKGIIVGALGYFISPFDAIPDAIPIAGFADDLGALAAAVALVAAHLNKAHSDAAKKKLADWFG